MQKYLMDLFDTYIDPGLKFIKKEATQGMDAVRLNHLLCMYTVHVCRNTHIYVLVHDTCMLLKGQLVNTCTCTCRCVRSSHSYIYPEHRDLNMYMMFCASIVLSSTCKCTCVKRLFTCSLW